MRTGGVSAVRIKIPTTSGSQGSMHRVKCPIPSVRNVENRRKESHTIELLPEKNITL